MEQPNPSRRQFLVASRNLASVGWLTINWPQIAAAAEHAEHSHMAHGDKPAPTTITTLSAAEAADVEAIAHQIVPSGKTPGARESGAIYFIDSALGSFFSAQLPAFRQGLTDFQKHYAEHFGGAKTFASASDVQQVTYLHEVDKTPFFGAVRRLTVLGMLAMPKYGGNRDEIGWKLIQFRDGHAWQPPFGDYEAEYGGFEPYPGTKPYTA